MMVLSSSLVSAQETEKSSEKARFIAGLGLNIPSSGEIAMNSDEGGVGYNFFLGGGFWKLDFVASIESVLSYNKMTADSSFGEVGYKKTYDDFMLGLSVRYRIMQNHYVAPYVGVLAGAVVFDVYDNVLGDEEGITKQRYCYGPVAGVIFFPNNWVNVFLEGKYRFHDGSVSDYTLSSKGINGEWNRREEGSINLDGLYISGGVSCTIF